MIASAVSSVRSGASLGCGDPAGAAVPCALVRWPALYVESYLVPSFVLVRRIVRYRPVVVPHNPRGGTAVGPEVSRFASRERAPPPARPASGPSLDTPPSTRPGINS